MAGLITFIVDATVRRRERATRRAGLALADFKFSDRPEASLAFPLGSRLSSAPRLARAIPSPRATPGDAPLSARSRTFPNRARRRRAATRRVGRGGSRPSVPPARQTKHGQGRALVKSTFGIKKLGGEAPSAARGADLASAPATAAEARRGRTRPRPSRRSVGVRAGATRVPAPGRRGGRRAAIRRARRRRPRRPPAGRVPEPRALARRKKSRRRVPHRVRAAPGGSPPVGTAPRPVARAVVTPAIDSPPPRARSRSPPVRPAETPRPLRDSAGRPG